MLDALLLDLGNVLVFHDNAKLFQELLPTGRRRVTHIVELAGLELDAKRPSHYAR